MRLFDNIRDAVRKKKSRDFAQELANQFWLSPICSDYENLFAQVRPLIDEMKTVVPYAIGPNGRPVSPQKAPEIEWLKNPNDDMGWCEFADLMFATWLTEDELDIHVWRNDSGQVIGYTIIPPECRMYLGYGRWEWQVMTTRGLEVLTEDEVMRLRFSRSPRNVQRGVSPASSVRVWAMIDDLISQYQKAYFENGAVPATITFITASTEEKYRKTRDELENKLKGAKNRNKTVYAWRQWNNDEGRSVDQIEVKTIQGNNSTLAIKEIVSIINDRLNKAIGVSNFILGDDASAKYDNAELSDHQFTKRRVYPALVSFWNQFQHELERILGGGLGYAITFDLEIPELTEREKAKAEIGRIRTEALTTIISAGSTPEAAVLALNLPEEEWLPAAQAIYKNKGELKAPEPIVYSLPAKTTVDGAAEAEKKAHEADASCGHNCTCHHSLDELPEMTPAEREIYDLLVDFGRGLIGEAGGYTNLDDVVDKMTEYLVQAAERGEVGAAEAIQMLSDEEVAAEILQTIGKGEIYVSDALKQRLSNRARLLAEGYEDATRQAMEETLASTQGMSASEITTALAQSIPRKKAEIIARNETVYAIRSGRLEQDEKLANDYGLNVELVWRTSGDSKVCPVCAAMAGQTVKLGDAFPDVIVTDDEALGWDKNSWNDNGRITSAHVNCVLGDTKVLADGVKAATRMVYSGDIVKFKTAQGKILSVTPNHILLTDRGWVSAKNLKQGDKIVAHTNRIKVMVGDNTINGDEPTVADEFISLSKCGSVTTVEVPVTAKDFKGDALTNEKVQVILPNSFLRNIGDASSDKFSSYLPFVGGKITTSSLNSLSSIDQLLVGTLLATNSIVGGSSKAQALLGSCSGHSDVHRFTSTAAYHARLQEAAANSSSADIKALRDSFLADAGLIEFDDIVNIEIYSVHNTPVYDIETTSTLYTANGVVSSNCRCYWDEVLV